MPRPTRLDVPGVPQHVIQRGNDRQPCFFADADYLRYRSDLREVAMREGCAVHAYVLMTNHVHLLVTPTTEGAIGPVMQSLGRRYVRYINDRYRRTGTLWEGRYKACPVENGGHLMRCHRYMTSNSIRCAPPRSSIRGTTGGRAIPTVNMTPWSRHTPGICRYPATRQNVSGSTVPWSWKR